MTTGHLAGRIALAFDSEKKDRPSLSDSIGALVHAATQPPRPRTAEAIREDIPRFLELLDDVQEEMGLSEEDAYYLLRMYLSRYFETRVGELLSGALSHALPRGARQSGIGSFSGMSMADHG